MKMGRFGILMLFLGTLLLGAVACGGSASSPDGANEAAARCGGDKRLSADCSFCRIEQAHACVNKGVEICDDKHVAFNGCVDSCDCPDDDMACHQTCWNETCDTAFRAAIQCQDQNCGGPTCLK